MSTIASYSPLNILEIVRERLGSKGPPIGNGIWGIKWSRDRWRHVTWKVKLSTPIGLERNVLKTAGDAI